MPGADALTFGENSDMAFLRVEDIDRFMPTCSGMANGEGGWIILGAFEEFQELHGGQALEPAAAKLLAGLEGVPDAEALERSLTLSLRDSRQIDVDPVSAFHLVEAGGKKLLAVQVRPVDWFLRPVRARGRAYRRVEGVNVASGREACLRMALDALELLRDDFAVSGLSVSDLDPAGVESFRAKVTARLPQWAALPLEIFLKRALVLDDAGKVTRAGALLLAADEKNSAPVHAALENYAGKLEERTFGNFWTALTELAPLCGRAGAECLLNAMLHGDHDFGRIEVELRPDGASFSNPGLPRVWPPRAGGRNETRNARLLRMLKLAGLASGQGRGLKLVLELDPAFRLRWDTLELRTVAELSKIELSQSEPAQTGPPRAEQRPAVIYTGWLPVVEAHGQGQIPSQPSDDSTEKRPLDEPQKVPVIVLPVSPSDEPQNEDEENWEDTPDSPDSPKTSGGEAEISISELSPLIQSVRDTARPPLTLVRDAILELCAEYQSMASLAAALSRSEASLRRHYLTAMVREGLLEMEFPDRVGHPEQRYRATTGTEETSPSDDI